MDQRHSKSVPTQSKLDTPKMRASSRNALAVRPGSRVSYSLSTFKSVRAVNTSAEFRISADYLPEKSGFEFASKKGKLQALYGSQCALTDCRYQIKEKKSRKTHKEPQLPIVPELKLYEEDSSLVPLKMTYRFSYPSLDIQAELVAIANALVSKGKGILVVDESTPTLGKLFMNANMENTDKNRREFQELLFSCDPNLSDFVSGVIVNHETFYQKTESGILYREMLAQRNLLIGIKLDSGTVPLFCSEGEVTTQGLDDLDERSIQYKKNGCHFAKWRCIYRMGKYTPSSRAINENASTLARFASICQAHRIVPIINPEVLADGDHDITRTQKITEKVLVAVIKALNDHHVLLECVILKPNIITPGTRCPKRSSTKEIATATLLTLQHTVPTALAGIAFLSGGLGEAEVTVIIDAINKSRSRKPWPLTFCFGCALQASLISYWKGLPENKEGAQDLLLRRAKILSLASKGWYYKVQKRRLFKGAFSKLQK